MCAKYRGSFWGCEVLLLAIGVAFGQPIGGPRIIAPAVASPVTPVITILTAATGALVRRQGFGNASVDLGRISYFKGHSASGESSRELAKSFVISTRFVLKIECPGSAFPSSVNVTISRLDTDAAGVIAIDGTRVGPVAQILLQSMSCDSSTEHRLEVEVPVTTLAGSLGTSVEFVATLNR